VTAGAGGTGEPAQKTKKLVVFHHFKRYYGTQRLQVELQEKSY